MSKAKHSSSRKLKSSAFIWAATLLFVLITTATVAIFEGSVKQNTLKQIRVDLEETAERLKEVVTKSVANYKADLRFLHSTPPIAGLPRAHFNSGVDTYDGTTYTQWKERLETIFIGFMENNLAVEQLRVIAINAEGNELVRVQRRGAAVEAVPDYSLQNKAGEGYFLPSSQLGLNQIYMSPLSLNREFGDISFPYKPMLRFAIPIYSEQGKRFAFLIMNVNANQLISQLVETTFDYSHLVITSSEGDVIYHPNEQYRFTRDLAPDITWSSLYSRPIEYENTYFAEQRFSEQQGVYIYSEKVQTRPNNKYGFVNFNVLTPETHINGIINEKRLLTYSFLTVVVLLSSVLIVTFHRSAIRSQLLADARRESSAIVEGSIDAIVGIDLKGQITSINHAAEQLLVVTSQAGIGKYYEQLSLLQKLPVEKYITDLQTSETQIKDQCEVAIDERALYLAVSVSPVVSESQDLIGIALIIRDISKEKAAELKVKRLNSELEAKVRQRTRALAQAKDEALKSSDIKSAFISNISHELRTPLNGVIGTLNILKREPLSEKARQFTDMMELSASNLRLLINDILDLSKIEAGKLDLNAKPFDPVSLLESLVGSCAVRAYDKGLEVFIDTQQLRCTQVVADPLRFTQIVNNLISNAIKFTEQGYIRVIASGDVVDGQSYRLQVSVEDSGMGINEQAQPQLFKAFSQADGNIAARYGGTGLGLSICKQLCQLMAGDISVSSQEGEGSTFSFYISLPLESVAIAQKTAYFADKSCAVICTYEYARAHVQRLIEGEGGRVHTDIEQVSNGSLGCDFIFIDGVSYSVEELSKLVTKWQQDCPQAQLVLLQQPGTGSPKSLSVDVVTISKPLTHSDLLRLIGAKEVVPLISGHNDTNERADDISEELMQRISGCRVLIVDDNEINVEVACGVLNTLPVELEKTYNGKQAIDMLQSSAREGKAINCVLMDCQMPVLDGYQTSEQIRAGVAGSEFTDIPIIAMTANAMMGEREKCLTAGMSDYISKPINPDEALEKVLHWGLSNYDNHSQPQAGEQLSHTQDSEQPLWDRDAALSRLLNKEVLLNKICRLFIKTAPQKLAQLHQSLNDENHEQVRQVAHSLKGLCGEISATRLHQLLAEVEHLAGSGTLEMQDQVQEIDTSLPELIADIEHYLEVSD
ncbi:ATP-binding protein [Pseudoalteromonas sp. Cnat2-41]|uniref:ATP-binding protein n=1 Tax=unclassified Pseudoalteromonas TaxID=194690 RepID=UPI001EF8E6C5|nr:MULTISPECIES: ATP-binding protein [unclassified Pseudoalteromonas]MCF2861327.1 ATP-binding protein [Pseudoalteromonas sp. CNAT2-18]MCG7557634.1 ATP-binding protein [Pseudoalteromonas sp. CNAT2-18.1]